MGIEFSFSYPCTIEENAVTIFFFIDKLPIIQSVALIHYSTLDDLLTADDGIDDMLIQVGSSHLDMNRFSVIRESVRGSIEPVMSFDNRLLVVYAKYDELLFDFLVSTLSIKGMLSRCKAFKLQL